MPKAKEVFRNQWWNSWICSHYTHAFPPFSFPPRGLHWSVLTSALSLGTEKAPSLCLYPGSSSVSLGWIQASRFLHRGPLHTRCCCCVSSESFLAHLPHFLQSSVTRFCPLIPTGIMLAVLLACSRLSDSLMGEGWKIRPGLLSGCFLICYGIVKLLVLGRGRKEAASHCIRCQQKRYNNGRLMQVTIFYNTVRNQTGVCCIAGGFFTSWATREALWQA